MVERFFWIDEKHESALKILRATLFSVFLLGILFRDSESGIIVGYPKKRKGMDSFQRLNSVHWGWASTDLKPTES